MTRSFADLPSPPRLPLLGSALAMPPHRLHTALEEWSRTLGPTVGVQVGSRRIIVMSQTPHIEEVLRARPERFRRITALETILAELGVTGVFSAEGDAWKPQRKLAMDALAAKNLRAFYPHLADVTRRLIARWDLALQRGATIDVLDDFKRLTVDVTTKLVFGHDLDTLGGDDEDELNSLIEPIFPALSRRINALVPYWRWFRLAQDRQLDASLAKLFDWLGKLLARTRAELQASPERRDKPTNFLEAMLVSQDEKGQPFSDAVIIGNALTLMVAGEDTTATTLAWAVHELCDDPAARAELRAEAERTFAGADVPPDLDVAHTLRFAGAVTNETLRLRPAGPVLLMEGTSDTTVGDIEVPRGTVIALLVREPARSTETIADAAEFRPARWLEQTSSGALRNALPSLPFGSGPRICPGRSLALLEMNVVLASIYRRFDLTREGPRDDVKELFAFSMSPTGLRVTVRPAAAARTDPWPSR
jgi:cytochrome P450